MKTVTTAVELGNAIKNGEDEIIILGDLSAKVIKIKATGKVAWILAYSAVSVAITAVLTSPSLLLGAAGLVAEGTLVSLASTLATSAVAVWGLGTTVQAIAIGVGAKNTKVLRKLKDNYEIVQNGSSQVIIRKKRK